MEKRCLLIMPLTFYSMAGQLQLALNSCGYEVTLCNDRYPDNLLTKVLWKTGVVGMLYQKTYSYIEKHFLQDKQYDICILIKGYGVTEDLITRIYKNCTQIVGYNFDSFAFHPLSLSWYRLVDHFYTFDYNDALEYDLKIVELYAAIETTEVLTERFYDISVIQKIHSDRLSYTCKVLSALQPERSYIYLHESNCVTMILNFLRHPVAYLKLRKYIHFKPLSYTGYIEVLRRSEFTLDFAHPRQSGITMRCFEAVSCGTKIITNNKHVFNSSCFNRENTIVAVGFKDIGGKIIQEYRKLLGSHTVISQRNTTDFIKEIIGI